MSETQTKNNIELSSSKYQDLSSKIDHDNEIQSALKEGYEILKAVKNHKDAEKLFQQFKKEYDDLENAIKGAMQNTKSFSKEERTKIILELGDILKLADEKGITKSNNFIDKGISYIGDFVKKTDTKSIKSNAENLKNKNFSSFSKEEAITILGYLNQNYGNYKDNNSAIGKAITFHYSTLNELDDKREVNLFQNELVKKVFDGNQQFNNNFVLGFNQEKGNFLIPMADFERKLHNDNITDINSKALSNYFLYLESKGQINTKKLVEVFGAQNLVNLKELWADTTDINDDKKNIAKSILEKKGVLNSIVTLLNNISSSDKFIEMLVSNSKNPTPESKEQEDLSLVILQKNIKGLRDKMKNDFKIKFLKSNPGKEKEAEEMSNKLFEEINKCKGHQDMFKIMKIFDTYNEKYHLGLNVGTEVKQTYELKKKEFQKDALENEKEKRKGEKERKDAEKSGDKKALQKADEKLKQIQKQSEIHKHGIKSAEIAISTIGMLGATEVSKLAKQDKSTFDTKVTEARKQDKSFDAQLTQFEKYEKAYYKKYPEEKPKTETINDKKQTNETAEETQTKENSFSYANGTTISYSEVSGGYGIQTNHGVIEMNYEELQTVKKSEKALENMIHFRDTLDELNLGGLWKYRESIFQGLANKYTLAFNTKDDYLNKNELKIFLTAVLKSIGSPANNLTNFEDLKSEVKAINYGGILSGQEDVNKSGDSLIESIFIQKFDPKRTGIFELNAFQESISNLFGKSV